MNEKKVRCIIVGLGALSKNMLGQLAAKSWYETAAVVDVRDEVLAKAKRDWGLPDSALFRDLDAALSQTDADVTIVNTPSELHYEQTKATLEAGLHALVAKPLTNDFNQAAELVDLADARNLKLCVGQQMRYMKHYRAVKRLADTGVLGSIEIVNFLNAKPRHIVGNLANMQQPALYEMSCHHFDSLMALIPDHMPEWIMCDGFQPSWSVYSGPCMVNASIRFSGGIHVLYQGGFSSQAENYELRLEGSRGALRCRGVHMSIDTMSNEVAETGSSFSPSDMDADIPAINPWEMFFDIWHDYLNGGPEPPFSGRNNLRVFALLTAGIDSIRNGAPVTVAGNPRFASAFRIGMVSRTVGSSEAEND